MFKKIMRGILVVCLIFVLASCDDNSTPTTVNITSVNPANGGVNITVSSTITIFFSTSMNSASAEGAFSINPAITGTFTWSGDSMIFTPTNTLSYNTTYTITISTTAESSEGKNLSSLYTFSFTTETNSYSKISGIWDWTSTYTSNTCNADTQEGGVVVITENNGTGIWSGYASEDTSLTCPNKVIPFTMDGSGNITINVTNLVLDPNHCGDPKIAATMDLAGTFIASSTTITGNYTYTYKYTAPITFNCTRTGTGTMTKR